MVTATKRPATKVVIPFLLQEAVRNGRAILFLGAGASKECRDVAGRSPPDGDQLRDLLAIKYMGRPMPTRSVQTVAEMAIENGAGQPLVFDTVANAFDGLHLQKHT